MVQAAYRYLSVRTYPAAETANPTDPLPRCTKPGGYFEHAELGVKLYSDDNTMKEGSGIKLYFEYLADALVKMGRAPLTGIVMKEHLEEAGFVDVTVIDYKQPFGPWPRDRRLKQIGAMMLLNSESGFHAYGMAAFTRVLGMTAEEATKACANGVRGARDKNSHCYNNL